MDRLDSDDRFCYLRDAKTANLKDKSVFAGLVKRGRSLTGLSLRETAEKICTAPGTVSRWEHGHCAPPLVARKSIIGFFCLVLFEL